MFGLFAPKPPVDPWVKAWVEYRFAWLIDSLGSKPLLATRVLLPTDDDFPEIYRGTLADAQRLLKQLAGHMQIDADRVRLQIRSDDDMPDAAGQYERSPGKSRPIIRVAASQFEDPEGLIATLAHELAHEILLGDGLLQGDEWDHEWVTDLLPVYYGLGVFAANSTIRETTERMGRYSTWSAKRSGYLPSQTLGYAMAIFHYARQEQRVPWAFRLRLDARSALLGGLRYLDRTTDCFIDPEHLDHRDDWTPTLIHERLGGKSPSQAIIAMWQFSASDEEAMPDVIALLRHRSADVRWQAAAHLSQFGAKAAIAITPLVYVLHDTNERVRAAACQALGELKLEPKVVTPELAVLLQGNSDDVVIAAANALRQFGRASIVNEKHLLAVLHKALVACNDGLASAVVGSLRQTLADPGQSINDYFRELDAEYRHAAIDALYNDDGSVLYETEGTSVPEE